MAFPVKIGGRGWWRGWGWGSKVVERSGSHFFPSGCQDWERFWADLWEPMSILVPFLDAMTNIRQKQRGGVTFEGSVHPGREAGSKQCHMSTSWSSTFQRTRKQRKGCTGAQQVVSSLSSPGLQPTGCCPPHSGQALPLRLLSGWLSKQCAALMPSFLTPIRLTVRIHFHSVCWWKEWI